MMRLTRLLFGCALGGAALTLQAQPAPAYPDGTVRLVVPFAAGSVVDVMGRLLAQSMAASLAVPVIVDNVPGAGGTIGVDRVARAAPDGRTLVLAGDAALVLSGGSYGVQPPYQTLRDLAPVAQVAVTPNVLIVSNDVAARTVQDLVTLVRSQPGRFNYVSTGIGLSQHRAGELMNSMAGLDMVHVPNSVTGAMGDLVAGRVHVYFANIGAALPMAREGKVRALAVSSLTRTASAPELPTVSESGLPGFESVAWFGLLAPAGTPASVVQRLESEVRKALATPEMSARLKAMGAEPPVMGTEAFVRVIRDDIAKWAGKAQGAAGQRP